jgi:hypothetical protein
MDLPVQTYALPDGATIDRDGTETQPYWTVNHFMLRLSIDREWDVKPLPSSRDAEWIARHAFATPEAAYQAYLDERAVPPF